MYCMLPWCIVAYQIQRDYVSHSVSVVTPVTPSMVMALLGCFAVPTRRVEGVTAVVPWDWRLPWGEHVVQRPAHQHWVEDTANACDCDHSSANSFTRRHNSPYGTSSFSSHVLVYWYRKNKRIIMHDKLYENGIELQMFPLERNGRTLRSIGWGRLQLKLNV